jgi:hypothetical protein
MTWFSTRFGGGVRFPNTVSTPGQSGNDGRRTTGLISQLAAYCTSGVSSPRGPGACGTVPNRTFDVFCASISEIRELSI